MSVKKKTTNFLRLVYKFVTLKLLYPLTYHICAIGKVDPKKVVFIEVRMQSLSNNYTLLWNALEKEGKYKPELFCLGLGSCSNMKYMKNCFALIRKIARARFIFISHDSNVFSSLPIRKGTTVIQTWHGCGAFKRVGMSSRGIGSNIAGSMRERKFFPICRNMDYITISSEEVAWAYEEAFDLHEGDGQKLVATGTSRTDIYFDTERIAQATERVRARIPNIGNKKIILYAPTFRGDTKKAILPDKIDIELMRNKLSDKYVLVIKHHPVVRDKQIIPQGCEDFAFDLTDHDVDDLLMAADICITDYSSLSFDYSLLKRPMIFFVYDIDEFIDWRGFYYPFDEFCPGKKAMTTEEIVEAVLSDDLYDEEKMSAFRKRHMGACDGHATERVLALMKQEK